MTNVTTAGSWREKNNQNSELKLPSGNVCLVRRAMGLQAFLRDGQIPNGLLELVEKHQSKGQPPSKQDPGLQAEELLKDPKNLKSIIDLCDNVCIQVVIEPQVHAVPKDDSGTEIPLVHRETSEDFIWVDEVDFEDKMFIFQWAVGGTADWTQFRGELAEHVGNLPGGQNMVLPPLPPPGN